MPFSGVAMVRDEADVVEAFVRHNLQALDRLYVVDHRSSDGTREILHALAAEGLPIAVELDDGEGFRQSEVITRLARRAFSHGATCVFALDADEFLKVPSRVAFKRWIASVPALYCAGMEWQTYVVDDEHAAAAHPLAAARQRRAEEAHGLHKVILTESFARNPRAVVGPGNHLALTQGPDQDLTEHPETLAAAPPAIVALAHLPARSPAQLLRKIRNGWRAHLAAHPDDRTLAAHWRQLYEEFERDDAPSGARFRELSLNYGLPPPLWRPAAEIALIDDPLPATVPLRYRGLSAQAPA
jgi:hypothetical protein